MSEELESTTNEGAEKALDALESAADVTDALADISAKAESAEAAIEEASESAVEVVSVIMTLGVVAIGAATAGYFFAKHRLQTKYEALAEKEIQEAKAFYSNSKFRKNDGYSTPDEALETLKSSKNGEKARKSYAGEAPGPDILERDPYEDLPEDEDDDDEGPEPDPDMPPEEVNVFLQRSPEAQPNPLEWNWDEEILRRQTATTYVITHDEFAMNESGYDQETIFWFEGDGVATSYDEKPLPSPAKQLGMENLSRFGVQSIDPNIVYIRNTVLEMDMEVVRRDGKYVDEVLGFRHADDDESYWERKGALKRMKRER